ncbi:MAG: hypothetical protein M3N98_06610, partial [Actinomycetota bacterium]|nr:hypothetical protein [Actinomycetota bacterium]
AGAAGAAGEAGFGSRQHYLRWDARRSWNSLEQAGVRYDSSIAYPDHVGFRAGCCYEYPTFDLAGRRRLRLTERPLIVMESSLLSYMGLTLDQAEQVIASLSDTCRTYGGDFTLLWHNHMLVSRPAKLAYQRILAAIAS